MEIYYLPGRTGSIEKSFIVECILGLGHEVVGRNLQQQDFLKQLAIIEYDIKESPRRPIICNSYGCYLLLQTLIQMKREITMPLCFFSPVIGTGFATGGKGIFYSVSPPRSEHIHRAIKNGDLKFNSQTTFIHAGENDQGSIDHFGGATVNIVKDAGHHFSEQYIKQSLNEFIRPIFIDIGSSS